MCLRFPSSDPIGVTAGHWASMSGYMAQSLSTGWLEVTMKTEEEAVYLLPDILAPGVASAPETQVSILLGSQCLPLDPKIWQNETSHTHICHPPHTLEARAREKEEEKP